VAMPVDGTGTASVAPVVAPQVPGVQKPPLRVGKQFWDCLVVTPEKKKVKRPGGLRTRPAWSQQDRLGASPAVCHGDVGSRRGIPAVQALKVHLHDIFLFSFFALINHI
jgi:hypothetical protein